MKREKLSNLSERDLITGLIISDKFCQELLPIIKGKHFETEYARVIFGWVLDYYSKFRESPKKNIIKLYRSKVDTISDDSLLDNLLKFVEKLYENYENTTFNEDFLLTESIKYLKKRELICLQEDLDSLVSCGDIDKAETKLLNYKSLEKVSGKSISLLDKENILGAFDEENDVLFTINGAFGDVIGDIHREDFISFLAPMKRGKCLGYGTKILMADGSIKEVQDLIVGDKLMGVDSKPRNVQIVSKGFGKMYRVKSRVNKNTKNKKPDIEFTCNGDHILVLKNAWRESKIKKFRRDGNPNGEYTKHGGNNKLKEPEIEISVNDFLKLSKDRRERYKLFRTGVEFSERKHIIPPYLLGIWLGDGTSSAGAITTIDSEIIKYCFDWCNSVGEELCIKPYTTNENLKELRFRESYKKTGIFSRELKRLNCFNNKHIPEEYFLDSINNRMQLLAGIIDSDGYSNGEHIEITLMNKPLIKDIEKLCQQLGFKTTFIEKYKRYKNMYRETNGWAFSWVVKITGELSKIPVKLERKKTKDSKKFTDLNNAFSFEIEELGEDNYYGFVLDGDHKFLLADTTVSHNTFALTHIGVEALKQGLNVLHVSLEMSEKQVLKRYWINLTGKNKDERENIDFSYFVEDGDKWRVETKKINRGGITLDDVEKKEALFKRIFRGADVKIYAVPAYSLTVESLETELVRLEENEDFIPDVIIVDYADIMKPTDKGEYRNQLDSIWKKLRGLAQSRKVALFTASQSNRSGLVKDAETQDIAEDVRKIAHVTSLVAINQTESEKKRGIVRFKQLAVREGEQQFKQAIATQCLAIGRMVTDSKFDDEVILSKVENNDDDFEMGRLKK